MSALFDVDLGLAAEAWGDGEYALLVDALMEHGYEQNKKLRKFQLARAIEPTDGGNPMNAIENKPPIVEEETETILVKRIE